MLNKEEVGICARRGENMKNIMRDASFIREMRVNDKNENYRVVKSLLLYKT